MTDDTYQLQRANILSGRQLGMLSSRKAVRLLVRLENKRAKQAIAEAKLITLNRKGERDGNRRR